jgi:hypothetical protein
MSRPVRFDQIPAAGEPACDLGGGVGNSLAARVQHEFGIDGRLVAAVGSRKAFQLAGARLTIVSLRIARLADLCSGRDVDLMEEFLADAARLRTILETRRDGRNDRHMAVARKMRRHLRKAADVFLAVLGGEAEVVVEAGA